MGRLSVAGLLCLLAPRSESKRGGGGHGWALDKSSEFTDLVDTECTGITRVDYRRLDNAAFKKHFLDPMKPVLIAGATSKWGATKKWRKRSFVKTFGKMVVEYGNGSDIVLFAGSWHHFEAPKAKLEDFIDNFGDDSKELDKLFTFQNIGAVNPMQPDFDTPHFLIPFFQLERPVEAPKMWNMISLGEHGAGLPFHDHGDSWLGLVHGLKHWFMYAPGTSPNMPIDAVTGVKHWARTVLPTLGDRKPIQCTQRAGEILYVPQGWIHATLNVGEAVAVGGQLDWLSQQRMAVGQSSLAKQTNDYYGHKDVAVAISTAHDMSAPLEAPLRMEQLRKGFAKGVGMGWSTDAGEIMPMKGDLATVRHKVEMAARHFDEAIKLQPNNIPLYKMACDLYLSTGDVSNDTLDAIFRYSQRLAEVGMQLQAAAIVPEIAIDALDTASEYIMAGVHLCEVANDWQRVIRGLELQLVIRPGDAATESGVIKARSKYLHSRMDDLDAI